MKRRIVLLLTAVAFGLAGCATSIDKDTKLLLKGPKAELSRRF